MESVYQHCRNKIGINAGVIREENQMSRQVLASSTQPQMWSIHVVRELTKRGRRRLRGLHLKIRVRVIHITTKLFHVVPR